MCLWRHTDPTTQTSGIRFQVALQSVWEWPDSPAWGIKHLNQSTNRTCLYQVGGRTLTPVRHRSYRSPTRFFFSPFNEISKAFVRDTVSKIKYQHVLGVADRTGGGPGCKRNKVHRLKNVSTHRKQTQLCNRTVTILWSPSSRSVCRSTCLCAFRYQSQWNSCGM